MRSLLVLFFAVSYVFALNGGVYPKCNGVNWSSSPRGNTPGRVCIHCRNGRHIKLYTKYADGGSSQKFYTLTGHFIAKGNVPAIEKVCR